VNKFASTTLGVAPNSFGRGAPGICDRRGQEQNGGVSSGEEASMKLALNVNGKPASVVADDPKMPLLYALRDNLGLRGPRFGCGLGQCGSCTVLVDGKAVRSCSVAVSYAAGKKVVTLEGLGTPAKPHPLQQAFIDEQAVQCGYCINGMIMQAAALLKANAKPSEEQIRSALAENLCRCGTHLRIVRAVKRASGTVA
jgi:nicotinate dehydrogenase subunit A